MVTSRREARLRAVQLLFESEQRAVQPLSLLAERLGAEDAPSEFTVRLVEGTQEHSTEIDEALATYSQGWSLDRMPAVDRAVLRVGAYEVVWGDTPAQVALAEATKLATELSTDESPAFVNGLLARLDQMKHTLI